MGHALHRIIHAFAEADRSYPNAKIFSAKWDVKDGFWRLVCQEGEEWNFAYVLPQAEGAPVKIVVPTSLQMGWVESPPYFCAASETARDIVAQYAETPVGSQPTHKFASYMTGTHEYAALPKRGAGAPFRYLIETYVDDYIALAMPASQEELDHVSGSVMRGVHDVFPENNDDDEDPLSLKKLKKMEGAWAVAKSILGFEFNGDDKTLWLEEPKRDALLTTLHSWIRTSAKRGGIPYDEFISTLAKVRHGFISIPAGRGLLSPCNAVLRKRPPIVYLHSNPHLLQAIKDIRTLLRESTTRPTKCTELVSDWPDFVGIKDASGHGVGGIIVGENKVCPPTVFRFQWPTDISADINTTADNPTRRITNSDLELDGSLLLWLVMEEVCKPEPACHVALFSDNQPTVHWVERFASKSSAVA